MNMGLEYTHSLVQSIQHAVITIAAGATVGTATIEPVNTAKTSLHWGNQRSAEATLNPAEDLARVTLTDATTITATRNTANASDSCIIAVDAVQWQPWAVTNVIYDTVTSSAGTQADKAISSVNTGRSVCIYLGQSTDRTLYNVIRDSLTIFLQSSTNVRLNRGSFTAGDNITAGFCVIEFADGVLKSLSTQETTIAGGATTGTTTIGAVDTSKTCLIYGSWRQAVLGVDDKRHWPYAELTNGTTITATRNTLHATSTSIIRTTALEFNPEWIKGNSRAATTITSGNASANESVSVQDLRKVLAGYIGATTNTSSTSDAPWATAALSSATQFDVTRGSSPATTLTVSWESLEFL